MLEGLRNWQIAKTLKIKERTVKFHVANVLRKKGCGDRLELILKLTRRHPAPPPAGSPGGAGSESV